MFRPVTLWIIQCDGDLPHGPCRERYHAYDDEGQLIRVLLEEPRLSDSQARSLNESGWMLLPDGRVHCPGHVAAAEYLMRAAVDELSFEEGPA